MNEANEPGLGGAMSYPFQRQHSAPARPSAGQALGRSHTWWPRKQILSFHPSPGAPPVLASPTDCPSCPTERGCRPLFSQILSLKHMEKSARTPQVASQHPSWQWWKRFDRLRGILKLGCLGSTLVVRLRPVTPARGSFL